MIFREERSEMVAASLYDIWEENYVKNRQYMMSPDQDRDTLRVKLGIYARNKGPAMIVGAGPSWKKNIDQLDHSLYPIIACDKMVPMLYERGIVPEIVVALNAERTDVKDWLKPIADQRNVTLVMPAGVHPDTYADWRGHIHWVNAMVPTGLHKRVERETHLTPDTIGSNAGTFAYKIAAEHIGYNKIGYMGLDFSYLTKEEVMNRYVIGREDDGDRDWPVYDDQYNVIEMTDINGDVRWLDLGWWDMAQAFQECVKRMQDWYYIETFNCTEGGINLSKYTHQMTLAEFNKMLKGEFD